jgi:hypothetical protein
MNVSSSAFQILKSYFCILDFTEMKNYIYHDTELYKPFPVNMKSKTYKICFGYKIMCIIALYLIPILTFYGFYQLNRGLQDILTKGFFIIIVFCLSNLLLWICLGEHKIVLLNTAFSFENLKKIGKIENFICGFCALLYVLFFAFSATIHIIPLAVDENVLPEVIDKLYFWIEIKNIYYQIMTVFILIFSYFLIYFSDKYKVDNFKYISALYAIMASSAILQSAFSILGITKFELNASFLVSLIPISIYFIIKIKISYLYSKFSGLAI